MVVCHLPYGPTAYFGVFNTVLRHDIGGERGGGGKKRGACVCLAVANNTHVYPLKTTKQTKPNEHTNNTTQTN